MRGGVSRRSRRRARVAPRRSSDWLAAAKIALKPTSSMSTEWSSWDAAEVEVVALEVDGEREHAQAVVVGRPFGRRAGGACRSAAGARAGPGGGARRPAPTTACATRASARIHGGVESRPHSHGWMSVTSVRAAEHAARGTTSGGGRRAWAAARRRTRRARRRAARPATRSTAIGDDRRLRDAGGGDVARRTRVPGRLPDPPAPDVVRAVGEDHVRQHAVGPLAAQQGAQLAGGPRGVEAGDADGGEARVPQPLVRDRAAPTGRSNRRCGCGRARPGPGAPGRRAPVRSRSLGAGGYVDLEVVADPEPDVREVVEHPRSVSARSWAASDGPYRYLFLGVNAVRALPGKGLGASP